MTLPFRPTVCIETGRAGKLRAVGSVREAAVVLVCDWPPEKRDRSYVNACEAAHAALDGRRDPDMVRTAFVLAARDAGIFVREGW